MRRDKYIGAASSRVALRLPGLRVYRRLRAGSQDRRSAPPPGMRRDKYIGAASSRLALRLPGQESTAVCGPVARTGAARRLRENPAQLIFARRLRALKAAQLA
ncbi:TPA: hypothetical protein NHV36_005363 [Klebsiella michiganensis]|nr:hypothetical protein [Klebsiella michiganensis]HCE8860187.1 hypothetical protein [Klebsiella michiganensis]HCE9046358.1 hypothetical protein [Klebsiella michiganensis]HCE9080459.1 hypothetical protein [Klebsiella michiganensis]